MANFTHLEDLDPRTFIETVRNLGRMHVTEKLDGTVFWVGIDNSGKLFTSRPSERAERFYSEPSYPYLAANNALRAAHAALNEKAAVLQKELSPGNTLAAEILYGRQQNTVTYGADELSYIVILGGANGTSDDVAQRVANDLNNLEVSARYAIVESNDGVNLDRTLEDQTFRFVDAPPVASTALRGINLNDKLKKLEAWLRDDANIDGLTNEDLISVQLGTIDKERRDAVKRARQGAIAELKLKFQLPIKRELLDRFVGKIKPKHGGSNLLPDEDNGVAGVNIKDPTTGAQIKLVDSDTFGTIKDFNHATMSLLNGPVRTTDPEAPIEARGGVVGLLRIQIAELLGNADLAINREARKIFANLQGNHATEVLRELANILHGANDFLGIQRKIIALTQHTIEEVDSLLKKFRKNESKYSLALSNGRRIGLSPSVVKRTLAAFAETKRDLTEQLAQLLKADTFGKLIGVLYGRDAVAAVKEKQASGTLEEGLLLEKRVTADVQHFVEVPDSWTLLNIYFATILAAVVMYKAEDRNGIIRFLKDQQHHRLNKLSVGMSAVNYWGFLVWRSSKPQVAKILTKKIAAETFRVARKIPWQHARNLHMDMAYGKLLDIRWEDHLALIKLLQRFAPGMLTTRINMLIDGAFKYDTLTFDEKVKYLPKLYFYVQQFVPSSPLQARLRIIQTSLLQFGEPTNPPITTTNAMAPGQKFSLLGEDGEIAPGPNAGPAAAPTSVNSGAVSSVQGASAGRRTDRHLNLEKRRRPVNGLKRRDGTPLGVKFRRPLPGEAK